MVRLREYPVHRLNTQVAVQLCQDEASLPRAIAGRVYQGDQRRHIAAGGPTVEAPDQRTVCQHKEFWYANHVIRLPLMHTVRNVNLHRRVIGIPIGQKARIHRCTGWSHECQTQVAQARLYAGIVADGLSAL